MSMLTISPSLSGRLLTIILVIEQHIKTAKLTRLVYHVP